MPRSWMEGKSSTPAVLLFRPILGVPGLTNRKGPDGRHRNQEKITEIPGKSPKFLRKRRNHGVLAAGWKASLTGRFLG